MVLSDRLVGCGCGRKGTEEYILQCKSFFLDDFSKSELVANIAVTGMQAGQSRQPGHVDRQAGRPVSRQAGRQGTHGPPHRRVRT